MAGIAGATSSTRMTNDNEMDGPDELCEVTHGPN